MSTTKLVSIGVVSFVLGVLACWGIATLGWEHRAVSSYDVVDNTAHDVARYARYLSDWEGGLLSAQQFQQRMLYRTQRLALSAALALPDMRPAARNATVDAARMLQANAWVLAHDTVDAQAARDYILRWAAAHPLAKR